MKNQNPVVIILQQRQIWRRSSEFCNGSTIASGSAIGSGDIYCISFNCYYLGILASVSAPCVGFSVIDNWSVAENSKVISIPANITFEAAFQGLRSLYTYNLTNSFSLLGNAWISTLGVGGSGSWSVSTQITTIPRPDGMN